MSLKRKKYSLNRTILNIQNLSTVEQKILHKKIIKKCKKIDNFDIKKEKELPKDLFYETNKTILFKNSLRKEISNTIIHNDLVIIHNEKNYTYTRYVKLTDILRSRYETNEILEQKESKINKLKNIEELEAINNLNLKDSRIAEEEPYIFKHKDNNIYPSNSNYIIIDEIFLTYNEFLGYSKGENYIFNYLFKNNSFQEIREDNSNRLFRIVLISNVSNLTFTDFEETTGIKYFYCLENFFTKALFSNSISKTKIISEKENNNTVKIRQRTFDKSTNYNTFKIVIDSIFRESKNIIVQDTIIPKSFFTNIVIKEDFYKSKTEKEIKFLNFNVKNYLEKKILTGIISHEFISNVVNKLCIYLDLSYNFPELTKNLKQISNFDDINLSKAINIIKLIKVNIKEIKKTDYSFYSFIMYLTALCLDLIILKEFVFLYKFYKKQQDIENKKFGNVTNVSYFYNILPNSKEKENLDLGIFINTIIRENPSEITNIFFTVNIIKKLIEGPNDIFEEEIKKLQKVKEKINGFFIENKDEIKLKSIILYNTIFKNFFVKIIKNNKNSFIKGFKINSKLLPEIDIFKEKFYRHNYRSFILINIISILNQLLIFNKLNFKDILPIIYLIRSF